MRRLYLAIPWHLSRIDYVLAAFALPEHRSSRVHGPLFCLSIGRKAHVIGECKGRPLGLAFWAREAKRYIAEI